MLLQIKIMSYPLEESLIKEILELKDNLAITIQKKIFIKEF